MTDQPVIVDFTTITAGGTGSEANFQALLRGETAFSAPTHFDGKETRQGIIHALDDTDEYDKSRAERLLELLALTSRPLRLPANTPLYLATTVGAIDRLERGENDDSGLYLLTRAGSVFGRNRQKLIAAACASDQRAIISAAQAIMAGQEEYVVVVGCDIASEFVTSGFASLGALTATLPRPYDTDHDGLALGEAGALLVLGSPAAAKRDGFAVLGKIAGWAESCDARHITAPDTTGHYLTLAIRRALTTADWQPDEIGAVMGHGTGTRYNDESEIEALISVFGPAGVPLVSIKGNWGHTLGATGIVQTGMAMAALRHGKVPPQAGLQRPAAGADKFVSTSARPVDSRRALSLNIGFGGINSVLAIEVAT